MKTTELKKINFTRSHSYHVNLTDEDNLDKIREYILPVIEKNDGWGTKSLTKDAFVHNPQNWQDDIDSTIMDNVHILLENNEPIGILEYVKEDTNDDKKKHKILRMILESFNNRYWKYLLTNDVISKPSKQSVEKANRFLQDKPLYSSVGVVLHPRLQGKGTGYSEKMYSVISDGIVFGWTSNPIIVRKRRQIFSETIFFPLFNDLIDTSEKLAAVLYVCGDLFSHPYKDWQDLEYGALRSPYFVKDRSDEYLSITEGMLKKKKLTQSDAKRIRYVISHEGCAGAIMSYNE